MTAADREQELFELYDSCPRSTLAMYLARDKLRIGQLEAERDELRARLATILAAMDRCGHGCHLLADGG
jgi:hypothetical protein